MIEVYLGNDLGNLSESDCKAIKEAMDGKSYYNFVVGWSNFAGNCQLLVKTSYPQAEPEDVKNMFLSIMAVQLARKMLMKKVYLIYEGDEHLSKDSMVLMGIFNNVEDLKKGARQLITDRLNDNFHRCECDEETCSEEDAKSNFIDHSMKELMEDYQTHEGSVLFQICEADINEIGEVS